MKRFVIPTALALAICLFVTGCSAAGGSSSSTAAAMPQATGEAARNSAMGGAVMMDAMPMAEEGEYYEYDMAAEEPVMPVEPPIGGVGQSVNPDAAHRKIIYTADVSLQTKEFDQGIASIEEMTARYEGFVQSSSVQGKNLYDYGRGARYAYYTVRIPETGLRTFLSELEGPFNVGSSSIYSDDITGSYYDTEARLEYLKVQQERLLDMLEKAEDVEYLIEVQKELARVNYEIESYTSSLNRMKDSVAYSTVNLSVEEVVEYETPQTIHTSFGEQIGNTFTGAWRGFVSFCKEFVLFLVSATPFLVIAVPLLIALILVMRARRKKRMQAAQAWQDPTQMPPQQPAPPQQPQDPEDRP